MQETLIITCKWTFCNRVCVLFYIMLLLYGAVCNIEQSHLNYIWFYVEYIKPTTI